MSKLAAFRGRRQLRSRPCAHATETVQIDGVDPIFMNLPPERDLLSRISQHGFRYLRIVDVELHGQDSRRQLPLCRRARFRSRAFRHNSIYVAQGPDQDAGRSQRQTRRPARVISSPHTCGLGSFSPGSARGAAVGHHLGRRRDRNSRAGRRRSGSSSRPACACKNAPEGTTISALLEQGEIDGFIAPRPPSLARKDNAQIGWLLRRSDRGRPGLFQANGDLSHHAPHRDPAHARREASVAAGRRVQGVGAGESEVPETRWKILPPHKVTLPFVEEQLRAARELMGHDFWSYGLAPNRKVLDNVPSPPSCRGSVVAARLARGAVSSRDARELRDLRLAAPLRRVGKIARHERRSSRSGRAAILPTRSAGEDRARVGTARALFSRAKTAGGARLCPPFCNGPVGVNPRFATSFSPGTRFCTGSAQRPPPDGVRKG